MPVTAVLSQEPLPLLATDLVLEIHFRRLLASCEDIAKGDCKGREDLKSWQVSPTYHQYVDLLQEQLIELESTGKMPLSTIEAYKKHTMALSNALHPPQIPRLCQLVSTARQQAKQLSVPGLLKMPSQPAISTFKALEDVQGYTTDIKNRPIPLSTAGQAHLESQKQAQETLTDELVGLAAAMKSNTLALETKVQERGRLLDGTEAALNESSLATKTAVEKAKAIHRRGRLNFCLSCLVIFLICGGFAGMFIFIRITSFVGYKNYKGTSSASQPLIPHQTPPTPLSHEEL